LIIKIYSISRNLIKKINEQHVQALIESYKFGLDYERQGLKNFNKKINSKLA
jgi:hypothetical protein